VTFLGQHIALAIIIFPCMKFRQNARNKNKKGIFLHTISFFSEKNQNLRIFIFLKRILPHLDYAFFSLVVVFKHVFKKCLDKF
jgi:hypothetical protein